MSKSPHVSDPLLQPFVSSTFSPTDYLNQTLPPLHIPSTSHPTKLPQSLSLGELATQTQTHITQLSAQTSRLSDTLTQLTDDILRSGSRLAYEVEVLRGEANSLSEALTDGLNGDIAKFVPEGLTVPTKSNQETSTKPALATQTPPDPPEPKARTDIEPPSLPHLRTLHHVRAQLTSTISTFDLALSWPLPPSLLPSTSTSSLISVSAPSTTSSLAALEQKGQEATQRLRNEIANLLSLGGEEGILAAEKRVEELRALVGVWRGTREEKARRGVVEALAMVVAERMREEEGRGLMVRRVQGGRREEEGDSRAGDGGKSAAVRETGGGPGFLKNLQRLRSEIYLE